MLDLTTPQTQYDIYRYIQGVKIDKLWQQTDINTRQAAELDKLADDFRKSGGDDYAYENFFVARQLQEAYRKADLEDSVGDLNAVKGFVLIDEKAKLFNDIKESSYTDVYGVILEVSNAKTDTVVKKGSSKANLNLMKY